MRSERYSRWQGWMIAARIDYLEIEPATWQAFYKLTHWRKRGLPSPLELARKFFAHNDQLQHRVDEGKAVAMLLANMAYNDHLSAYDRSDAQAQTSVKAKVKKRRKRAARKAQKAQQQLVQDMVVIPDRVF